MNKTFGLLFYVKRAKIDNNGKVEFLPLSGQFS